jgi:hypothetical protein
VRDTEEPLSNPRFSTKRQLARLVGELFVIVAGVLIALWADGWAENRADRQVENSRIGALRENVLATQQRLKSSRDEFGSAEMALRTIAYWDSPSDAFGQEEILLEGLLFGPSFTPELNVYADLKSSGDLGLLTSGELRQALAAMDAAMMEIEWTLSDMANVQQLNFDRYVIEEHALGPWMGESLGLDDLPEDPVRDITDFRELRNLALFKLDLMSELDARYDRMAETLDRVLVALNSTAR